MTRRRTSDSAPSCCDTPQHLHSQAQHIFRHGINDGSTGFGSSTRQQFAKTATKAQSLSSLNVNRWQHATQSQIAVPNLTLHAVESVAVCDFNDEVRFAVPGRGLEPLLIRARQRKLHPLRNRNRQHRNQWLNRHECSVTQQLQMEF